MRISPNGVNLIKNFEGLRLESYLCQAKIWTIGYGSTGPDVGPNQTITKEEAEARLRADLASFESAVSSLVTVKINQNEFDALVSFTFNVGVNAFRNSTLLRLLNQGSARSVVASEFLRWINADGKPSEGLKNRRQKERDLFLTKPLHPLLGHSIVAQRDTWLKREPKQAADLPAERKLFVPKNSAHEWDSITILPGEQHYRIQLSAQPQSEWWFWPNDFKIINDPKPAPAPVPAPSPSPAPTPAPSSKGILLNVPYYSQRDNKVDPMRTCFSSSCAMLLKFLKPKSISGDDEYIQTVYRYGDTTDASVQLKALRHYGLDASFHQTGSWSDLDALLRAGIPVPIGILHKGPVSAPTGGGHWIVVVGRSEDGSRYIVNDPFGDLDLVNGGYLSSNGKQLSYSKRNLGPRWLVESPRSGWYIRASV